MAKKVIAGAGFLEIEVPASPVAEARLIELLLIVDQQEREEYVPLISESFFTVPVLQSVWQGILTCQSRNQTVNWESTMEVLAMDTVWQARGGLKEFMNHVKFDGLAMRGNISLEAAYRLALMWRNRRSLQRGALQVFHQCSNEDTPIEKLVEMMETTVEVTRPGLTASHIISSAEQSKINLKAMSDLRNKKGAILGIPSRVAALNEYTLGEQPGQLIIVGAATSIGKSSFIVSECEYQAEHYQKRGQRILIFSTEMPRRAVQARLDAARLGINQSLMRIPSMLDASDWRLLEESKHDYAIDILDRYITPTQLVQHIRRAWRAGNPYGKVVVDYVQSYALKHQSVSGTFSTDIRFHIAGITAQLWDAAKEFGFALVLASQVNRDPFRRADSRKGNDLYAPRPEATDLAEANSLGNDADVCMLLYRQYKYTPDKACESAAEINVAKQREGAVGVVPASFVGKSSVFRDRGFCNCRYCQSLGDTRDKAMFD